MSAFALTLGEFDRSTYEDSILILFFFHYFTIFVNIVLLNVLIAIISDTYERVEEKGKVTCAPCERSLDSLAMPTLSPSSPSLSPPLPQHCPLALFSISASLPFSYAPLSR